MDDIFETTFKIIKMITFVTYEITSKHDVFNFISKSSKLVSNGQKHILPLFKKRIKWIFYITILSRTLNDKLITIPYL